jgi:hypothetical protein
MSVLGSPDEGGTQTPDADQNGGATDALMAVVTAAREAATIRNSSRIRRPELKP